MPSAAEGWKPAIIPESHRAAKHVRTEGGDSPKRPRPGRAAAWGPFSDRQADGEGRPLAEAAFDGDGPVVGEDDVLDDGQAEARAAELLGPGLVDDVEPLEDVGQVLGVDADARVRDLDRRSGPARTPGGRSPRPFSVYFTALSTRLRRRPSTWRGSAWTDGRSAAGLERQGQALLPAARFSKTLRMLSASGLRSGPRSSRSSSRAPRAGTGRGGPRRWRSSGRCSAG